MGILEFKEVNCKNCYKCVRYCPVKSIEVIGHQAKIIEQECILCGNCTLVCPQKAKEDISELKAVREEIASGKKVYCMFAPSAAAYFESAPENIKSMLKSLGFCEALETAEGAFLVKSEYEALLKDGSPRVWVSSCCPVINSYIIKHRPEALPYLAPVVTPMQAGAARIRRQDPEAVIVFAGPCIAKKGEALEEGSDTDYVLTFEEIEEWLVQENQDENEMGPGHSTLFEAKMSLRRQPEGADNKECVIQPRLSRFFPVTGGILKTMKKEETVTYLSVDGLDACMEMLDEIAEGKLTDCFIEMSACKGSCIGGPSFRRKKKGAAGAYQKVAAGAISEKETDFEIMPEDNIKTSFLGARTEAVRPTDAQIAAILKKMGKNSPEDELNCGMCGYENCRKKAVAVFQNRAEISMCLPFMKERAESFSDQILKVTPNAILTVDMDLKVQQMNEAAAHLFGVQVSDVIGGPVSRIMDEFDFVNMMINDIPNVTKNAFLTEYNCYVEQVFRYDKASSIIICIMKDISADRNKKNKAMKAKLQAASMADDIVEKQLRIVHEIASLLGETAAETKLAVADLKETIMMDKDEI